MEDYTSEEIQQAYDEHIDLLVDEGKVMTSDDKYYVYEPGNGLDDIDEDAPEWEED